MPSDHDDPIKFHTTSSSKKVWDTQYADEDTERGRKVFQSVKQALVNAGVDAHQDAIIEAIEDSEDVEIEAEYDSR